jgi:predicted transposase YbfD/YdcC
MNGRSIDAMGTQKAIAGQIIDQQADYVLALNENQQHCLRRSNMPLILCHWISQQKKWMQITGA